MGNYLTPPSSTKLASKAVKSVASRVGNLKEGNQEVTNKMVQDALIEAFKTTYGEAEVKEIDFTTFPPLRRKIITSSGGPLPNSRKDATIQPLLYSSIPMGG